SELHGSLGWLRLKSAPAASGIPTVSPNPPCLLPPDEGPTLFSRTTAALTGAALALTTGVVTLAPAAHAVPQMYTGHVQVVVGDTVVGCVVPGNEWARLSTDASRAYRVSIPAGSQQDLTILDEGAEGLVLGVDATL